jgi:ectoine hydroxylase-related dioxygenase (phytanoyl-CoA dioxygenase family)
MAGRTTRPPSIADPSAVTDDERAAFFAAGFTTIARLVDDETVAELRAAYDEIITGRTRARGDRRLGGIIRQVKDPSLDHPTFETNPALEAGVRLASSLFDGDAYGKVYEMLIDKPSGTVHETPWHQDVGYTQMPVAPAGTGTAIEDIQIWLALDPVDEHNGCMQFIPRAYGAPSLAHRVAAGDPDDEGRLIAVDEPLDISEAIACPLDAGGCTIHLMGTPHFTGPNDTARSRRAYIFNIGPATLAEFAQQAIRSVLYD